MGRTVKLLLYYFAYQLAFYGIFTGGYMLLKGSMEMPDPSSSSYITFLLSIQLVSTLAVGLHLIFWKYVKLDSRTWSLYNNVKLMLVSLFFIVGMGLWNNFLSELVDLPNTMQDFFEDMMRHPLGIMVTVVMAPLVEELLFRGAIQGHLLRTWKSPVLSILTSSLIFGLVHGNPAQIPFAFVIGLALGWMYYMTGSLVPGIFMHFINNGSAVLFFFISNDAESGMISTFGMYGAAGLALLGFVVTIFCVGAVRSLMKGNTRLWNPEE